MCALPLIYGLCYHHFNLKYEMVCCIFQYIIFDRPSAYKLGPSRFVMVSFRDVKQVTFCMAIGISNSCTNVVPNTCALEQQQWNINDKETGRRQAQKIKHGRKKWEWNKEILLLFIDASSMIILVNICFFQTYIPCP